MASGSFNVTTSNQYISGKLTWSSTSNVSANTSDVTATLRLSRTNTGYTTLSTGTFFITINGTKSTSSNIQRTFTYNSNTLCHTFTLKNIPHNSDGTKSITITVGGTQSMFTMSNQSGTAKLDTIPRASQPRLSSSSRAIGQSVTIYTDRASSSFTHTITYKIGATTGTISSSAGDSVTWTIPDVSNRITNSTSGTCTITCVTKSGSTTIGTKTVNLTITIPNAAPYLPTISSITTSMVRGPGAPSGMTAYVSGYSKISASMSGASAGKNASIKSYKLIINGVTYNSSSATSDVISKSGTVTVTAQITDSRGRTSTVVTKNITFTAYKPPSITTFKAARQSTSTTVKVDWAVSYLNITGNSITTKIETKRSTDSSWSSFQTNTTATSGSKTLTGVSDLVTQQFRITSTDSFGNSVSRIISVGTAKVAFSIGKNEGIGAGKVWERGALDVGGDIYVQGKVYADGINIPDTRDVVDEPQDLPSRAISFAFKRSSTVGNPPVTASSTYSHIIRVAGRSTNESSGGWPTELSVGTKGIAYRQATSATNWNAWKKIWSEDNDGSGSGLDADLLDGKEGSSYLRIVSSGSNSNGYYIRFSNGLQICWKLFDDLTVSTNTVTTQGLTIYKTSGMTWTFPAAFKSGEKPSVSMVANLAGSGLDTVCVYSITNTSAAYEAQSIYNWIGNGYINEMTAFAIGYYQ